MLCNTCPRKWIGISKDTNACFISFDWGVKSYSVNKAPGTGLMITKMPPSVSYSRFLFFFFFFGLFICAGENLQEGPGRGKPQREHGLSVCVGSGAGNSSHFCSWLDMWPQANHSSSVGLAPSCLSLGTQNFVIQKGVEFCCSELIPFLSVHCVSQV